MQREAWLRHRRRGSGGGCRRRRELREGHVGSPFTARCYTATHRTMSVALPPQVHVFVRDWLSGNQVVLRSPHGHVVVDSGYGKHVPLTLALVASRRGLDGDAARARRQHALSFRPHGRQRRAQARVRLRDRGPGRGGSADRGLGHARAAARLCRPAGGALRGRRSGSQPGTTQRWGDLEWRLLAAPGHDMAALVFYNPEHGILISGDALWEDGFGFVMPPEMDPAALPATRATLDMLAALDVASWCPGHGEPFTDVRGGARARLRARSRRSRRTDARIARHARQGAADVHAARPRAHAARQSCPRTSSGAAVPRLQRALPAHDAAPSWRNWLVDDLCRAGGAVADGALDRACSGRPARRTAAMQPRTAGIAADASLPVAAAGLRLSYRTDHGPTS